MFRKAVRSSTVQVAAMVHVDLTSGAEQLLTGDTRRRRCGIRNVLFQHVYTS